MRLRPFIALLLMTTIPALARDHFVYLGAYTETTGKGIYVARFDPGTGRLGEPALAAEVANPSFLAFSPDRTRLYAVTENAAARYDGKPSGTVNAFAIDAQTGRLTFIDRAVSGGRGPCHLAVSPDGKNVFVANYGSGSVALLPVLPGGGVGVPAAVIQHEGHGPHPTRQKGPHAHSFTPSPDGRFAYAVDLGTDRIYIDAIDSTAHTLTPAGETAVAPGSGPRHLAFSRDGRFVYLASELAGTVTTFARDPGRGSLTALQTLPTLPHGFTGKNTAAEIAVDAAGRFVYVSNRGRDDIAIFRVDPAAGTLAPAGEASTRGKTPRHFSLDPTGRWLVVANQDSNDLVVFAVDPVTGHLTPTGQSVPLAEPTCVRFL